MNHDHKTMNMLLKKLIAQIVLYVSNHVPNLEHQRI
jgi:hypothetical protein